MLVYAFCALYFYRLLEHFNISRQLREEWLGEAALRALVMANVIRSQALQAKNAFLAMKAHFRRLWYFLAKVAPELLDFKPGIPVFFGFVEFLERLPLLSDLIVLIVKGLLVI